MKKSILVSLLVLGLMSAYAQDALNVGYRLGVSRADLSYVGLVAKKFISINNTSDTYAIEGMFTRNTLGENVLTALFEIQTKSRNKKSNNSNVNLFYGGGVHTGFWNLDLNGTKQLVGGVDLIGGINYKIRKKPIVLTADIKPYYDLYQKEDLKYTSPQLQDDADKKKMNIDMGITIRYYIDD